MRDAVGPASEFLSMRCEKGEKKHMNTIRRYMVTVALSLCAFSIPAGAQAPAVEGIPMNHQLTEQKCGGCHQKDSNGMMRRLSYMRTSPEVWEQAIKRMVRLNGVSLKPEEAREILKYLSTNNGLAPEEAKPVFWEAEHRMLRDQSDAIPADALQHTCNFCHTIGRVLNQRRTKDDYDKLISMHVGLFPGSENTFRPRRATSAQLLPARTMAVGSGNPSVEVPSQPGGGSNKYPVDVAVEYLAKNQPLMTKEWAAWKSAMKSAKVEGKWLLTGYQVGKGRVFGTLTVEAGTGTDEYNTKLDLEYASTGQTFSRSGKSIVYTGYSWRGRSTAPKADPADPNLNPAEWREALLISRDGNTMDGRWFWGSYQEFGMDAHLVRIGTAPMLAGANVFSVKSPSTTEVKLYGANLPAALKPSDVDLGAGVTVKRVIRSTPTIATVELDVAAKVPTGIRDVALGHAVAERAIAIYDSIGYVKIAPDASMARLGGGISAKQFAQFETIAYAAGADGKPMTADDVPLGPVKSTWSMDEFTSTPDDDDVKFVGNLNAETGLFTPAIEGPNPERKKQSNNYPTNNWGDVWVAATYTGAGGTPMKARAYLVVTIPMYVRWDQPEVGQ